MSDTNAMAEFLAEHPKMVGALFTMTLLLSQAGAAVAGNSPTTAGP